jgi:hypothetical protein
LTVFRVGNPDDVGDLAAPEARRRPRSIRSPNLLIPAALT